MSELVLGTAEGVFAFHLDSGKFHAEDGPGAQALLASAGGTVYAVTDDAAAWRRTGHNHWELMNPRAVEEQPWTLGADARVPGLVWLGVSPAMLYRSSDGGASWTGCDTFNDIPGRETWTFPPPPHIPHVRSIFPDPAEAGGVYVGVEEGGVFRSTDDGVTWESLNEGLFFDVHEVVADPDAQHLYATTGCGFHRSDDGGRNWLLVQEGIDRPYTMPLVASPEDARLLYTAAAATPPPGWRANGTANAAIYRSEDGGAHWRRLTNGLPASFEAMVRTMVAVPGGALVAAAANDLYVSEDNGRLERLALDRWRRGLGTVRHPLPETVRGAEVWR